MPVERLQVSGLLSRDLHERSVPSKIDTLNIRAFSVRCWLHWLICKDCRFEGVSFSFAPQRLLGLFVDDLCRLYCSVSEGQHMNFILAIILIDLCVGPLHVNDPCGLYPTQTTTCTSVSLIPYNYYTVK